MVGAMLNAFKIGLAILIWLAVVELGLWVWGGVNLKGTDAALLIDRPELGTYGWQPDSRGVSFGQEYAFDDKGMRVYGDGPRRVLLVGDSVAFAVGVRQSESIAAVIAAETGATVFDASVIGYGLEDHAKAFGWLVEIAKPDVVVVMLTLNDIQPSVRKQILSPAPEMDFVQGLNEFLRARSRTYLWAKGILDNTAAFYFRADRNAYEDATPAQAARALRILDSEIPTVFLLGPYRYETEAGIDQALRRFWMKASDEAGVTITDFSLPLLDTLKAEAFLWDDPMHLSREGAAFVGALTARMIAPHLSSMSSE